MPQKGKTFFGHWRATHHIFTKEHEHELINILLFIAAPFVGLLYLIAFPIAGAATLLWLTGKTAANAFKIQPIKS
ncbi:MAG: hypothetical protein HY244_17780 [Rhizobiales bacterium]|nr:hypothetical protein [Hyphomicrobiales bacterium]